MLVPRQVRQVVLSTTCVCVLGLGGAVGYALGGLNWTNTFLGVAFKSQEQILFFFAAILFTASVVLHLFSIEEQRYVPQHDRLDQVCVYAPSTCFLWTYITKHVLKHCHISGEPGSCPITAIL